MGWHADMFCRSRDLLGNDAQCVTGLLVLVSQQFNGCWHLGHTAVCTQWGLRSQAEDGANTSQIASQHSSGGLYMLTAKAYIEPMPTSEPNCEHHYLNTLCLCTCVCMWRAGCKLQHADWSLLHWLQVQTCTVVWQMICRCVAALTSLYNARASQMPAVVLYCVVLCCIAADATASPPKHMLPAIDVWQ